ncbi:MAG: hypothetical protein L3J91_00905 [Thermoplasmata archaeon]|nr:hypothetical protein [Thermoplasmata archaeon]
MDRRRILRLAEVLVASQMRAGRSTSTSADFWGRPLALAAVDVAGFLIALAASTQIIGAIAAPDPSVVSAIGPQILAFLPLFVLGSALLAGILFELSQSGRFAASDAANWLPISPYEYVAASSLAATFVYSITASVALGIGVAVTWYSGDLPALVATAVYLVLALFQAGILIEILRASTQRIGAVMSKRTGRVTIVLRLALSVLIILAFEFALNPLILYQVLETVSGANPLAFAIPFLWPSRSLLDLAHGDLLGGALYGAGTIGLSALLVVVAAVTRVRFWAPAASELQLGAYAYAAAHPWLAALGLTAGESSVVWKDLRGLVRRRELNFILAVPMVIAIFTYFTDRTAGSVSGSLTFGILASWVPAFFALMLATTCFGQERKAIQTLYALPLAPREVFRAKAASVLIPSLGFAVALWLFYGVLLDPGWPVTVALLILGPTVTTLACFLGLTFSSRYSDFQERPRPRYMAPSALIAAMLLGMVLSFGIAIPVLAWAYGVTTDPVVVVAPAVAAVLAFALTFRLARSGTDRLMRAVPV